MEFGSWSTVVVLSILIAMIILVRVGAFSEISCLFIVVITTGVACGAVIGVVLVVLPIGLPPAENFGNLKPWVYILALPASVISLWALFHPSNWYARTNVLGVHLPVHGGLKSLVYIIGFGYFGMLGTMGILGLFDDRFIRYADNITSASIKTAEVYAVISALILGLFLFCVGAWVAYDLLNKREAITTGELIELSIFMLLMGYFVVASLLYLF
jgi:hypothetical protein